MQSSKKIGRRETGDHIPEDYTIVVSVECGIFSVYFQPKIRVFQGHGRETKSPTSRVTTSQYDGFGGMMKQIITVCVCVLIV